MILTDPMDILPRQVHADASEFAASDEMLRTGQRLYIEQGPVSKKIGLLAGCIGGAILARGAYKRNDLGPLGLGVMLAGAIEYVSGVGEQNHGSDLIVNSALIKFAVASGYVSMNTGGRLVSPSEQRF